MVNFRVEITKENITLKNMKFFIRTRALLVHNKFFQKGQALPSLKTYLISKTITNFLKYQTLSKFFQL